MSPLTPKVVVGVLFSCTALPEKELGYRYVSGNEDPVRTLPIMCRLSRYWPLKCSETACGRARLYVYFLSLVLVLYSRLLYIRNVPLGRLL